MKFKLKNYFFAFLFFHFPDDELEKFIVEVLKASKKGVSPLQNVTGDPNWSFGQALFFSTTVVTTIGKLNLLII